MSLIREGEGKERAQKKAHPAVLPKVILISYLSPFRFERR